MQKVCKKMFIHDFDSPNRCGSIYDICKLGPMDFKKLEASVDLRKSFYAAFELPPNHPQLDVHLCSFERTMPDYVIERKTFPYFALELVTHGRGRLRLKGVEHVLRRGSIFTYGPGVPHRIETDPRDCLQKYFIDLTLLTTRYDSPISSPGLCFETNRIDRLASLFDGILDDSSNGITDDRIRQNSVRLILDLASLDIDRENPVNSPAYQNYLAAKTHLERNHHIIGSVADLAASMKTDPSYISRLFKRYGNETPYQCLIRLKLARACYLLKRHDMQIQEIAEVLGFTDPFHFSTLFKRHIGVPPRQYRTQGKTKDF